MSFTPSRLLLYPGWQGRSEMFLKSLSSCDLNLFTEQEDIIRICLGNVLNILIARHLKLLQSVPCRSTLTCNTAQDLPLCSEYVHVIGAIIFHK